MSIDSICYNRVLLTNDDGIDAPGLSVLEQAASRIAKEVWVVAPEHDQSGKSHSLSLHEPLRVSQRGLRRYAVSGTPGDCVVMAIKHIMQDNRPELLLSGINRGANLGVETVFSGTVGACMTGMLLGIDSIALSQAYRDRNNIKWDTGLEATAMILRKIKNMKFPHDACLNINIPDVPFEESLPWTFTSQGKGYLTDVNVLQRIDPRSDNYYWLSLFRSHNPDLSDSEAEAIRQGAISVTPLKFDRTHDTFLEYLNSAKACSSSIKDERKSKL